MTDFVEVRPPLLVGLAAQLLEQRVSPIEVTLGRRSDSREIRHSHGSDVTFADFLVLEFGGVLVVFAAVVMDVVLAEVALAKMALEHVACGWVILRCGMSLANR